MRTLKKTLCLVLCLVMMVGLCAVGASAKTIDDYPDKDKIEHKEAVATLTALKVMEGDGGGFRPTDNLNRDEAAAVFTRLCGSTGAGISSFTDIAAGDWSQPYVAYCEANGIVSGVGGGRFAPKSPVTNIQWAKMCTVALGYDPVREGLVKNSAWEVNTIKLVNKLDLAKGVANIDWNAPISRDNAAQFAYNTLTKTMVEYKGGSDINVSTAEGTTVEVSGYVAPSYMINNSYDYQNILHPNSDDYMQFCEMYFPNLKRTNTADDDFGVPTNTWYMGNNRTDSTLTDSKKIVSEDAGKVLKTYDTFVYATGKTLYEDANGTDNVVALDVYENGAFTKTIYAYRTGNDAAALPLAGYAGATILLVDAHKEGEYGYGTANRLIVKYPYLATVTKVTAASATSDRTATLKIYNKAAAAATCTYTTEDFAKGDFVLVYPAGDMTATATATSFDTLSILLAEPAVTVAGSLTKVATAPIKAAFGDNDKYASALTIGGVAYTIGRNANLGPVAGQDANTKNGAGYVLGTGVTAYTSNGFVLGVVSDAVAYGEYVFSLGTAPVPGSILNPTVTYKVGYVDQTAASAEVGASNIKQSGGDASKGTYDYIVMNDVWATKTEATGGKFAFKPAADLTHAFTISALSSTAPKLGTSDKDGSAIVADDNTVFILRDSTGAFKAYTGLANVPNYKTLGMKAYALVPNTYAGAHAAAIYIPVGSAAPTNTTTTTIFLVSGANGGQEIVGSKTYYSYTAIIDGAVKPILGTETSFSAAGIVIPTYSGEYLKATTKTGIALALDGEAVSTIADYAISVDAGLITIKKTDGSLLGVYTVASDAQAFIYTAASGKFESGTPKEVLDGAYGGAISVELNKAGAASKIYLIK